MNNILTPRRHISIESIAPLVIPTRKWTRLVFTNPTGSKEDTFVLEEGFANIDLQQYADWGTPTNPWTMEARPTVWQTRMVRLDGTFAGNVTCREPVMVPPIYNFATPFVRTAFYVMPSLPLVFDVWHNAPGSVSLRETVLKLHVYQ